MLHLFFSKCILYGCGWTVQSLFYQSRALCSKMFQTYQGFLLHILKYNFCDEGREKVSFCQLSDTNLCSINNTVLWTDKPFSKSWPWDLFCKSDRFQVAPTEIFLDLLVLPLTSAITWNFHFLPGGFSAILSPPFLCYQPVPFPECEGVIAMNQSWFWQALKKMISWNFFLKEHSTILSLAMPVIQNFQFYFPVPFYKLPKYTYSLVTLERL